MTQTRIGLKTTSADADQSPLLPLSVKSPRVKSPRDKSPRQKPPSQKPPAQKLHVLEHLHAEARGAFDSGAFDGGLLSRGLLTWGFLSLSPFLPDIRPQIDASRQTVENPLEMNSCQKSKSVGVREAVPTVKNP